MPNPIVLIHWVDISCESGWTSKKDPQKVQVIDVHSVGWLVSKDSQSVRLALDDSADGDWGCVQCIPRGCIRKITILRESQEKHS